MPEDTESEATDGEFECPHDRCGNEVLDRVEDDPENDFFCHWCGGLFTSEEVV
jgi:hypothetical protein